MQIIIVFFFLQILIAVISAAWAQTKNVERPVRAPQGQIKYDDADGEYAALCILRKRY